MVVVSKDGTQRNILTPSSGGRYLPINDMNFTRQKDTARSSANAEIARHASCRKTPKHKAAHFFHTQWSLDTTIQVGFDLHVAKTTTYLVIC